MDEKNKIKIDIFSLIIAILAFLISVASFVYTVYKDNLDNTEQISITNAGYGYDELMSYNCAGGHRGQGMINGINYTIIVSNNSKQRISFISYDIFQETANVKYQYKNMIEKVKDSSNQEISFPFSIDSGESIALTFEINTLIPPSVNMLLLDEYGTDGEIMYDELRDYLGGKNLDIFGNEVSYTKYYDGTYLMEIDAPHYPVYSLEMITSRSTVFQALLTHTFQGEN